MVYTLQGPPFLLRWVASHWLPLSASLLHHSADLLLPLVRLPQNFTALYALVMALGYFDPTSIDMSAAMHAM